MITRNEVVHLGDCRASLRGHVDEVVAWRIRAGPAHHVVFLEPNHGGLTGAAHLDTNAAFAELLRNIYLPERSRGFALACLRTPVERTSCWKLRIGDLDRGLWHLREFSEPG